MGITFQLSGISPVFCSSKVQFSVLMIITQYFIHAILFLQSEKLNLSNVCNSVISLLFLQAYDATQLVKSYPDSHLDILIDQGKDDQFLSAGQLLPDNFIAACTERKIPVVFRLQQASCFCNPWLLGCCFVILRFIEQVAKRVHLHWACFYLPAGLSLAKWGRGWKVIFSWTSAIKECNIHQIQLCFTTRWGHDFSYNKPVRWW